MNMPRVSIVVSAAAMVMAGGASATEARYSCSGGTVLNAIFSPPEEVPGTVTLTLDGASGELVLPQVVSADGGRYAEKDIEFWIKGNDATLTRNGKSETCHTEQ
jgi:membrane-bound inhibitor of C-type lysozyme